MNLLNLLIIVSSNLVSFSDSISFFCSLESFLGVMTFIITYILPFEPLFLLSIPFPLIRCLSPESTPAGIVNLTLPYNVGIVFLQPNIASVIVIGTSR